MPAVVQAVSPSGCVSIEVVEGQGLITPINRPLVPRLVDLEFLAINDDASAIAYVSSGILHDLIVLVYQDGAWTCVFSRRLVQELVTGLRWQVAAPPELFVTTSKRQYLVYEWSRGWQLTQAR